MPRRSRPEVTVAWQPGPKQVKELILACHRGKITFVKAMLKKGVHPDILDERTGSRPLSAAADGGHTDIVRLLLNAGADPNLQDTWKSMPPNGTALEIAVQKGYFEIVKLLVKRGADVNKAGYWPPLKDAASRGRSQILRFLLACGATFQDSYLNLAARSGDLDAVKHFIMAGANVNYRNTDGDTPLHFAAVRDTAHMAELLISAGADVNAATFHTKDTPLSLAASRGKKEIVQVLLDAGANAAFKGWKGKTAEQFARLYGQKEIANLLRRHARSNRTSQANNSTNRDHGS